MVDRHAEQLESLLRRRGTCSAADIAAHIGISQATVSRLIAAAGSRVMRIGRARASRYAMARDIGRAGNRWPLYRLDANAKAHLLGELRALRDDQFHFEQSHVEPVAASPAFLEGEFSNGLFPGLPWFLDDQRPQGFLGRAFVRRNHAAIDAPDDATRWHSDDVILAVLRYGHDQPGDLVLGESSLQVALSATVDPQDVVPSGERERRYPQLAAAALRGDDVGSSAGGEQPKFAITVRDQGALRPVIVKFSDRIDTPAGRRWADLLISEHHAEDELRQTGIPAARTELIIADARVFLESTRFDRTPLLGRVGLVSLAALDAAHYGHGSIPWRAFAPQLERDGWIGADDARRLRVVSWFGQLIANADMHLGNASLHLGDTRPFALARVYDMLPMRFRPANSGEIVERRFDIVLPTPGELDDWMTAAPMARRFWARVADDPRVSPAFRALARDAGSVVERSITHLAR